VVLLRIGQRLDHFGVAQVGEFKQGYSLADGAGDAVGVDDVVPAEVTAGGGVGQTADPLGRLPVDIPSQ
jgi:hypothetical protein